MHCEESEGTSSSSDASGHVFIGSPQQSLTFEALEELKKTDPAFKRFRIRLAEFFNNFLPLYGISLPGGKHIKFQKDDIMSTQYNLW